MNLMTNFEMNNAILGACDRKSRTDNVSHDLLCMFPDITLTFEENIRSIIAFNYRLIYRFTDLYNWLVIRVRVRVIYLIQGNGKH